MPLFLKPYFKIFFSFSFLLLLIIFQNRNFGIDGYYYLAQFLYSPHLFEPHHLLHHYVYYFLSYPWFYLTHGYLNFEFLFIFWNSLFFVLSLEILNEIRKLIYHEEDLFSIGLVAFSGIGLRYATEVEIYIFPLFLALLATFYFLKSIHLTSTHFLFLGSSFLSFAVLNHQLMFIWWLVLTFWYIFQIKANFHKILIHLVISLSVPITYYLVASSNGYNFWIYILNDYVNGSADISFTWKNFVLTAVNLTRIFLFFNEAIFVITKNPFLLALHLILLVLLFFCCKSLLKKIKHKMQRNFANQLLYSLLVVNLAFIVFSHGNYEFMVPLPFILSLLLPKIPNLIYVKFTIILILFTWNFVNLLYPFHYKDFYGKNHLLQIFNSKQNVSFLLKDASWFRNFIYYHTGIVHSSRILMQTDVSQIDQLLRKGVIIYTDYPNSENINRRNFVYNYQIPSKYKLEKRDSIQTFFGKKFLYQIQ